MTSDPLVSVLINNYNYGPFIREAIESALAQTYKNIEIIVVDDGSTDNSREEIAHFDQRIRFVAKDNGGQASAFNAGFAASTGEIICFLDSDDLFAPGKVSSVVEIFTRNAHIGWFFHRLREFGSKIGNSRSPSAGIRFGMLDGRGRVAGGKPPFLDTATSGLSFRRDTLAQILPMPEVIRITSDNYLKFVAMSLTVGWFDPQELSLQRIHGNNAYTGRTVGRQRVAARTGLLTGICLYERFPILRPLAKLIFCRGLGTLWAAGGIDPDCEQLVDSFLASLALPARSALRIRAGFNSAITLF